MTFEEHMNRFKGLDDDSVVELAKEYGVAAKWYLSKNDIYAICHWANKGYSIKLKRQNMGTSIYILEKDGRKQEFKLDKNPRVKVSGEMALFDKNEELSDRIRKLIEEKA